MKRFAAVLAALLALVSAASAWGPEGAGDGGGAWCDPSASSCVIPNNVEIQAGGDGSGIRLQLDAGASSGSKLSFQTVDQTGEALVTLEAYGNAIGDQFDVTVHDGVGLECDSGDFAGGAIQAVMEPGFCFVQPHSGFNPAMGFLADSFGAFSANSKLAGTITISAAASGSQAFPFAYNSIPSCTITPTSDPTACGAWWVTQTTSAVTAHVHTSCTITFDYNCLGNPN